MTHLKLPAEEVKDFNVAGAICERIEKLAAEETLMKPEKKLRTEYKIIFEPIPHVNELLQDIVAKIHIKNAEKSIKSHSYPSPWKYKEVWHILIQQHLDAGRIRPSQALDPCLWHSAHCAWLFLWHGSHRWQAPWTPWYTSLIPVSVHMFHPDRKSVV